MIEKLIYSRELPAIYEISFSGGKYSEEPLHISAEKLDELQTAGESREAIIYNAAISKAHEEKIEDLTYTLRLMRPRETKKYIRSKILPSLGEAMIDVAMDSWPFKKAGFLAIAQMAHLEALNAEGPTGLNNG